MNRIKKVIAGTKTKFFGVEKKLQKSLLIGVGLSLINISFSLFSLYTIISFSLFFVCIGLYAKIQVGIVKKKGILHYLPHGLTKTLTQRSIFDILCDIWFFPRIILIVKAFLSPFIYKIEPQEAINQFKDFSPSFRKAIMTKGIVNILPSGVKSNFYPNSSESSNESEEEKEHEIRTDKKQNVADIIFEDTSAPGTPRSKRAALLEQNSKFSTDEDGGLINHNLSANTVEEMKRSFPSFSELNPLQAHIDISDWNKDMNSFKQHTQAQIHKKKHHQTKIRPTWTRSSQKLNEEHYKTETILSNKILERRQKKIPIISDKWDKIEFYTEKTREDKKKLEIEGPKNVELKGSLGVLQRLSSLTKKDVILSKLDEKKLLKIFAISALVFIVQLSVSKKTRQIFYQTLNILLYASGATLSVGSLALFLLKMKKKREESKKKAARINSQTSIASQNNL